MFQIKINFSSFYTNNKFIDLQIKNSFIEYIDQSNTYVYCLK